MLVSAHTPAFLYGEGCFETLFVSPRGIPEYIEDHLFRLKQGLEWLALPAPPEVNATFLSNVIAELKDELNQPERPARLRIQVSRGTSFTEGRGVAESPGSPASKSGAAASKPAKHNKETLLLISLTPLSNDVRATTVPSIRLSTVPTRVIPDAARPRRLKLTNRSHYEKAERESKDLGADEPLMLTTDGFLSETSRANIFWIEEGKPNKQEGEGSEPRAIHSRNNRSHFLSDEPALRIVTPSEECDLLPGIIRAKVIQVIQQNSGIRVEQGRFTRERLLSAKSAFLTNSIRRIQTVESIDGHQFKTDHPFIHQLIEWMNTEQENA